MSPMNDSITLPVSFCQTDSRSFRRRIGVKVSAPSSWSHKRRAKLSTIATEWPLRDKYRAVAHPQYPSPPNTALFIFHLLGVRLERAARDKSSFSRVPYSPPDWQES